MLAFEKYYDLIVAGAGVAGVAAALEAARRGKRVAFLREAIKANPDHPENVFIKFKIATIFSQTLDFRVSCQ